MTNEYFAAGAAAADLDLVLWLHAEAVWERAKTVAVGGLLSRRLVRYRDEVMRLRREVEFEANGTNPSQDGGDPLRCPAILCASPFEGVSQAHDLIHHWVTTHQPSGWGGD